MPSKGPLPLTIYVLSAGSFMNDIASEMIIPFIPLFLSQTLGTPVAIIGIIIGISESLANVLNFFSGWLSDKFGTRKLLIITGYGLSTLAKLFLGCAYSWPLVLISRITDRIGKGTRTAARDALIADETSTHNRGKAFGLNRALDNLGAVIGPLLALLFLQLCGKNLRPLFFIALIPSTLCVALLTFFIFEKKQHQARAKKPTINWLPHNKTFNYFLIVSGIFALGNSSEAFLILRAQSLGLPVALTIFTYILFNLAHALCAYPIGSLADRTIAPQKILIAGYLLFAVTYQLAAHTTNPAWFWLLFPLHGIFMAMTESTGKTYIATIVNKEQFGTAFGMHQMLMGIGTFLASTIAGILWAKISPAAPFYFGSIMALIAIMLFIASKVKTQ